MLRPIFAVLFLTVIGQKALAQTTITNERFGFKITVPAKWFEYGRTEFDERRNMSIYAFLAYLPDSVERASEWQNSLGFTAISNEKSFSLSEFKQETKQDLKTRFPGIEFLEEDDSSISASLEVSGNVYILYYHLNFKNGVGYVSNYSNIQKLFTEEDKRRVKATIQSMEFFVPEVDYSDLDESIAKEPENGVLHYQKAKRAYENHDLELSLSESSLAIDLYPFYGEAYYLRAKVNLYLNDSVHACKDLHAALSEDYYEEDNLSILNGICENVDISYEPEPMFSDFEAGTDHYAYVDSLELHPYVITGSTESKELKEKMEQVYHLFFLDFDQLNKAFLSGNEIVKLYVFGIIIRRFPEQLTKEHRKLMKSKKNVFVFDESEGEVAERKVSELARQMYVIVTWREKQMKTQEKVERAVEKFIRRNAQYPESYTRIEFSGFREMSTFDPENNSVEKNSKSYSITLSHQLRGKSGDLLDVNLTFKLNHKFEMNIIEEEQSGTVSSSPPRIEDWLSAYGRQLSEKERKKLGLK